MVVMTSRNFSRTLLKGTRKKNNNNKKNRKHFEEDKEGHVFILFIERRMFCAKLVILPGERSAAVHRIQILARVVVTVCF